MPFFFFFSHIALLVFSVSTQMSHGLLKLRNQIHCPFLRSTLSSYMISKVLWLSMPFTCSTPNCVSWVWNVPLNFQIHACLLRLAWPKLHLVFSLKLAPPAASPSQLMTTLSFRLLRSIASGLPLHFPLLHPESGLTADTVILTFCVGSERDYTSPPHPHKLGPDHIIFCLDDCSRLQTCLPSCTLSPAQPVLNKAAMLKPMPDGATLLLEHS